jgi:hypothetical protein
MWCASIWSASPVPRVSCPYAPPVGCDRRPPTGADPSSNSIAGRRASGLPQVSLSKVPRHPPRAAGRASRAEALPMNANDFWRPIEKDAAASRHVLLYTECLLL